LGCLDGEAPRAIRHFEIALKLNPLHTKAAEALGEIQRELDR
jgi:hypothetical protein